MCCPDFICFVSEDLGIYKGEEKCLRGGNLISVYCARSWEYCPRRGGDDRFRRDDALTGEMSNRIISGFRKTLENGEQRLNDLLREVAQIVGRTNYSFLYDNYYRAGNQKIMLSVAGRFKAVVKTEMEEDEAGKLEAEMQKMLDSFEPADELPYISLESDMIRISDRDFANLESLLSQSAPVIAGVLDGKDVCTVPSYNKVTGDICRQLSDKVYSYLRGMQESFFEVQMRFQREIHDALRASEAGVHGFGGEIPRWSRGF